MPERRASLRFFLPLAVAAIGSALAMLVPAAKSDSIQVIWTLPTPADQSRITVTAGQTVSLTLTASVGVQAVDVHIDVLGAPADAVFNSSDGGAARATLRGHPGRRAITPSSSRPRPSRARRHLPAAS